MTAKLRLVWNADDLFSSTAEGGGGGLRQSRETEGAAADVDGPPLADLVWPNDNYASDDGSFGTRTPRRASPPPRGEGLGWGASPNAQAWRARRDAVLRTAKTKAMLSATAPHPNPSPHTLHSKGGGALISSPHFKRRKKSKLKFRRPRSISLRSLAALAVLIAGLVIAAQALFIPMKAQAAQFLMSRAWDHQVATGEATRPWPWADFTPAAKLSFPAQDKTVLALTDASGESLAFGPTLMAASAAPGETGVAVFAAHRDTHFAFLNRLQTGQLINVDTPTRHLTFKVIGSSVVRWDASGLHPHDGGAPRIALVTCWPLDGKFHGPMRYVVWAEMVTPEQTPT